MFFLLTSVIIWFLFVVFIYGQVPSGVSNLFLAYYAVQIRFINSHIIAFAIGFLILFLILNLTRRRKDSFFRLLVISVKRIAALTVTGSLLGLLLLLIIAFIELNVLSVATYINPNVIGVATNTAKIEQKLKDAPTFPGVVMLENSGKKTVTLIASAQAGKDGIYGSIVVPSIPSYLIIPPKKTGDGVLMTGDTVIVTEVDSPGFRSTGPVLANLMIKKYFVRKQIKSYPQISLMDKKEYLIFRREDFNQKLEKFDEVIKKIDNAITLLTETVEEEKKYISEKDRELDEAGLKKEKEYTKCVNAGYYKSGNFIRINSKPYCEEKVKDLDDEITKIKDEDLDLKDALRKDEEKLNEYKAYGKYYSANKLLTQEESSYISSEFGTFIPPDSIKIVLLSEDENISAADYFEILIHEYLHYASFTETGKKLTSSFFEEGLTEYFARVIIKYNLGIDTNMGYPVNVKIIDQMTKRIHESDLSDIFFANDQPGLEKLLDKVYGKNFYRDNIISLETLQYLSDKDEILKHANEIMRKIGGEPLREKDIYTSGANFN